MNCSFSPLRIWLSAVSSGITHMYMILYVGLSLWFLHSIYRVWVFLLVRPWRDSPTSFLVQVVKRYAILVLLFSTLISEDIDFSGYPNWLSTISLNLFSVVFFSGSTTFHILAILGSWFWLPFILLPNLCCIFNLGSTSFILKKTFS